MEAEALYQQLGLLIAETPAGLPGPGPITPEMHRWLGRAAALIEADGNMVDGVSFNVAASGLNGVLREHNAHDVVVILHRCFARAELSAPAATQGAFIPVGEAFSALQAMSKVLGEAKSDVLFSWIRTWTRRC